MEWKKLKIRDVADVESGFGFPRKYQGLVDEEIPFFKVNDMNLPGNDMEMHNTTNCISRRVLGELKAKMLPPGTTIFPKIGAAIATGKKRLLIRESTYDNNVMGLVPKELVNPRFLYYWALTFDFTAISNFGPVPSLRKSTIQDIGFLLPSLSEQRRIVEILDQAAVLRKKQAEARAKLEKLLPALFYEMFGESKKWDIVELAAVVECLDSKRIPVKGSERLNRGGKVPYYGANGLVGYIDKPIFDERLVLLAEDGGYWGPLENSSYIIEGDAWVNNHAHVLRCGKNITPEYLSISLNQSDLRPYISGTTRGKLTQKRMNSIKISLPPLKLQQEFSLAFREHAAGTKCAGGAAKLIDGLFLVLVRRAFSGDLTAQWREAHMGELLKEMKEQERLLAEAESDGVQTRSRVGRRRKEGVSSGKKEHQKV